MSKLYYCITCLYNCASCYCVSTHYVYLFCKDEKNRVVATLSESAATRLVVFLRGGLLTFSAVNSVFDHGADNTYFMRIGI